MQKKNYTQLAVRIINIFILSHENVGNVVFFNILKTNLLDVSLEKQIRNITTECSCVKL